MALDKQKILNELGSVVNQLQSADCGCMGKLFSNSNQPNQNGNYQNAPMMSPAHDGYMQGSCCHGHCGHPCYRNNAPGAGEPFSGNRNCMGFCNPPKLYADTYNYLNNNLMQPVVKEVYNDLKSISPANTMMNNPMAAQMGLAQGNNPNSIPQGKMGGMGNMAQNQMPGEAMGNQNTMPNHGPHVHFGNSNMANMNNTMQNVNPNNQQQMGQISQPIPVMPGMGPNIVKMMMVDNAKRGNISNPGGVQGGLEGNNSVQSPEMALTSNAPGDMGQAQYNMAMSGNTPGQYNNMGMNNMGQGNPGIPNQNPTSQHMPQQNMFDGSNANMQSNTMNTNMAQMNPGAQQMRNMNANPAPQQMNARNAHGQHSAGMAKFNEMFPGVMQGGDLGFDPMAIAIQMNPANQQRAAMDTMQKMMMSNGKGLNANNASLLQPVINSTNAALTNIAHSNQPPTNQAPGQQNIIPGSMQQQIPSTNAGAVPVQSHQVPQQQVPQQQIPTQQLQYHQQQQQQQMIDPNTGTSGPGTLPTVYEGSSDPNARQESSPPTRSAPPPQEFLKEPIFPADTSKNLPASYMTYKPQKCYNYNTLGQPIEMMPVDAYRTPEPNLPQTLSPQVTTKSDPGRYSNVKSTVSKTSLMGNRPVGGTPSRSQLQNIYNQYKGSQSFTQQNIRPPDNGASYSEGHLNVPQNNTVRQAPVEKIGGDTVVNNPGHPVELKPNQVGDVPAANKPLADAEKVPVNQTKVRNGLQDQTYTAYTTSAAWSFHGSSPNSYTPYRSRNKV